MERDMRRGKCILLALLATALVLVAAPLAAAGDKTVAAVEPTHFGTVIGRIYDASSTVPLEGAEIVVLDDGQFAASGRTCGKTDPTGQYRCQAPLGRVSASFDFRRAISSSVFGLLSGSGKKKTRRIDVNRLLLRVSKSGYKSFEGVVPCRESQPEAFTVIMEPILLTSEQSSEAPTVLEGSGVVRVLDVKVEPSILRPGAETTVTVRAQCPPIPRRNRMGIWFRSPLLGEKRFPLTPSTTESGVMVASLKCRAGRARSALNDVMLVRLEECPYDIAPGGRCETTLVQIATNDQEEAAARVRLEAYNLRQAGQGSEAQAKLKELCAMAGAGSIDDWQTLAVVSENTHDYDTAVEARKRAMDLAPEKEKLAYLDQYAQTLVLAGKYESAITETAAAVEKIRERDRPRRVPAGLMAVLGTAYVKTSKMDSATSVATQLDKFVGAAALKSVREFRQILRLANAEAAAKAQPPSAKGLADYGRALMDEGRWEEGVETLRKSLEVDPLDQSTVRDLNYALVHVSGGGAISTQSLDEALAATEKQAYSNGKPASKDFFTWHALSMLLYRKLQQQGDSADAPATRQRCLDALIEALQCGRAAKELASDGAYYGAYLGYYGSKVVTISGFAYPEANSDFAIYENLKTLQIKPDCYLAHFDLATALIELNQGDLAYKALTQCMTLKPDFEEARYASAVIALLNGKRDDGRTALQEVAKRNPRHPRANQALAKLYTEDGDMVATSACLAAHAKYYGENE